MGAPRDARKLSLRLLEEGAHRRKGLAARRRADRRPLRLRAVVRPGPRLRLRAAEKHARGAQGALLALALGVCNASSAGGGEDAGGPYWSRVLFMASEYSVFLAGAVAIGRPLVAP